MNEQQNYYIAKDIDKPIPIFFFDPVDFVLIIMAIGIGIIFKIPLIGFILAYFVFKLSKFMKKGAKRGAMAHAMWRFGIIGDKNFKNYNCHHNDFIN